MNDSPSRAPSVNLKYDFTDFEKNRQRPCPRDLPITLSREIPPKRKIAGQMDFELGQLVQIALGNSEFDNVKATVLHSVLNILLKKLDCQKEIVTLGGFEAECVKKMLQESKPSPLPFDDEQVENIAKKVRRFEITEVKTASLEEKVCKHFRDISRCKNTPELILSFSDWEVYNEPCEELYTRCDPDNRIACDLLHNTDFLRKLMRRISLPMVDRILVLERKIEGMSVKLDEYIDQMNKMLEKLLLLDALIEQVEKLKGTVRYNDMKFIGAMEELQDMLDAKLDKVHMPVLKKFIKERFDEVFSQLKAKEAKQSCGKAAGIIFDNITCVSCGNKKICVDKGEERVASLPEVRKLQCEPKSKKKNCKCFVAELPTECTLVNRINLIDVEKIEKRVEEQQGLCPSDVLFIEGLRGDLFRGDPNKT